jgi:hypothetical protein
VKNPSFVMEIDGTEQRRFPEQKPLRNLISVRGDFGVRTCLLQSKAMVATEIYTSTQGAQPGSTGSNLIQSQVSSKIS